MSVVAFTSSRFTPTDIERFNEVSLPRLASGIWGAVGRQTSSERDELSILAPVTGTRIFSFVRDRKGKYSLFFCDRDGMHRIGFADTSEECLSVWLTATRRRKAADAAATAP